MKTCHATNQPPAKRGFTLVEMLVSVTLILLMMTMFATIFDVATDSVHKQQGIAENDQKIRQITTLIKADLAKRTQRYPLAFYPGEDLDLGPKSPDLREGYFYLSTNDPDSKSDTVLQWTVRATLTGENSDSTPYFGSARALSDRIAGTGFNLFRHPNQPEVDDGSLDADESSSSPVAQISLFVRNGNLYRRVTLVRNPRRVAGGELQAQPTSTDGNDFFQGESDDAGTYDGLFVTPTETTNDFHRYFDFSAVANDPGGNQTAQFLGVDALSNKLTSSGAAALSFGYPHLRFGFDQLSGRSREHDGLSALRFIGRFLQAETSSLNFNWPMRVMVSEGADESDVAAQVFGTGNPYDIAGTGMSLVPGQDLVTELDNAAAGVAGTGGERRMEDLLLANVHEFSVEIWDERAGRFVEPGYGTVSDSDIDAGRVIVGDFHIRRNLNADVGASTFNYGPLAPYASGSTDRLLKQPHVFDTWHPAISSFAGVYDVDGDGLEMSEIQPPYTAYVVYPPRQSGDPIPGPSSPLSPAMNSAANRPSDLNVEGYWDDDFAYEVNDVVFARNFTGVDGWDADGDNTFNWVNDAAVVPRQGFQIAYRCIRAGQSGLAPPVWADTPGKRITESVSTGTPAVWESFDNRRPLKAIRITLRFLNQTLDQPRQLSLVVPLTDGI